MFLSFLRLKAEWHILCGEILKILLDHHSKKLEEIAKEVEKLLPDEEKKENHTVTQENDGEIS